MVQGMQENQKKEIRRKVAAKTKTFVIGGAGIVACVLLLLSVWFKVSMRWLTFTWSNLSMEELLYQLSASFEGTNPEMVRDYFLSILPGIVAALLAFCLISWYLKQKRKIRLLFWYTVTMFSVVLFSVTFSGIWNTLDVNAYIESQRTESSFVDEHYVDPAEVTLTFPQEKRNLIYIFLESMEATYSDEAHGGGFANNYIPGLTEIALENEDFSADDQKINGAYTYTGTTWTMGAMFAHTSGLPLNIPIDGNAMETQDSFFPTLTTLGDLLEEQGYTQTVAFGSLASFGGRKQYFEEHGNYTIHDYEYAIAQGDIPAEYKVWWGFEDTKLLSYAQRDLTELAAAGEPFNYTLLTADTHFENGYVCQDCTQEFGADQYANVISCSSRKISAFLAWIQAQDFYENTTVVIVGDHLTMDRDFCDGVNLDYDRKVYTAYINAAAETQLATERGYATVDYFPTTLAALGVQIEGERLGLGTNLFSEQPTLLEEYGVDEVDQEVSRKSEFFTNLTKDLVEVSSENESS
ncbi:MAG: sulfatase-like hydrolase/transferase [Lachnospiraceae bacterium]